MIFMQSRPAINQRRAWVCTRGSGLTRVGTPRAASALVSELARWSPEHECGRRTLSLGIGSGTGAHQCEKIAFRPPLTPHVATLVGVEENECDDNKKNAPLRCRPTRQCQSDSLHRQTKLSLWLHHSSCSSTCCMNDINRCILRAAAAARRRNTGTPTTSYNVCKQIRARCKNDPCVRSHVMHNNTCTLACWPARAGKRGPADPAL